MFTQIKVSLSNYLKRLRVQKNMTQTELATLISSSQSRVAKMEAADPTVSTDLIIKALVMLGANRKDIADAIEKIDKIDEV
jgi:transcriptional regulator with XRE-family HTH domain